MAKTRGDWAQVFANGLDLTGQLTNLTHVHAVKANPTQPFNVGVEQFAVGPYMPSTNVNGFRMGPQSLNPSAHNLMAAAHVGGATDIDYVISALMGMNTTPAAGDPCALLLGTLLKYDAPNQPGDQLKFQARFGPRGKRSPLGNVLLYSAGIAGTVTGPVFDRGPAAAAGTVLGAVFHFHVLNPTGARASGSNTVNALPVDNDLFTDTIGGVPYVYTFKNTPSAPGHVKIGATAFECAKNLFAAMVGSITGSGPAYFPGTTKLPSTVVVTYPTIAGVITITAVATGTAANAWTLAKTGTNLAVSGPNFSGGANGDSFTFTVGTATSSGGSYTTVATSTLNGTSQGADRIEVPIGVLLNRYVKPIATTAGNTSTPTYAITGGFFYQL
jgi:hypothetical protein